MFGARDPANRDNYRTGFGEFDRIQGKIDDGGGHRAPRGADGRRGALKVEAHVQAFVRIRRGDSGFDVGHDTLDSQMFGRTGFGARPSDHEGEQILEGLLQFESVDVHPLDQLARLMANLIRVFLLQHLQAAHQGLDRGAQFVGQIAEGLKRETVAPGGKRCARTRLTCGKYATNAISQQSFHSVSPVIRAVRALSG